MCLQLLKLDVSTDLTKKKCISTIVPTQSEISEMHVPVLLEGAGWMS